jgi:5-methylcytosine-specific restriction protein A
MRRRHLRMHPLCEICLESETVEPAAVVHHRQRHDGDEAIFFDEGQLQSLCWDCRNAMRLIGAVYRSYLRVGVPRIIGI